MEVTRMHNPPHPGEILQDTVLSEDGGFSVAALARHLGVSRVALSRVVHGRSAVSADMALRLAAALGGSAESWLTMQAAYDLWHEAKERRPKVVPLPVVRFLTARDKVMPRNAATGEAVRRSVSQGRTYYANQTTYMAVKRAASQSGTSQRGRDSQSGAYLKAGRDTVSSRPRAAAKSRRASR